MPDRDSGLESTVIETPPQVPRGAPGKLDDTVRQTAAEIAQALEHSRQDIAPVTQLPSQGGAGSLLPPLLPLLRPRDIGRGPGCCGQLLVVTALSMALVPGGRSGPGAD